MTKVSSDSKKVRLPVQKRVNVPKGITMHPDVAAKLRELAKEMCTSESGCIAQLILAEIIRRDPPR